MILTFLYPVATNWPKKLLRFIKHLLRDDWRMCIDCKILVLLTVISALFSGKCLCMIALLPDGIARVFFIPQYFEHIDTAKVTGEMLTALFAAMAQAESESISRNGSAV